MLKYLLLLPILGLTCQEAGHCVMYDACGYDPDIGNDGVHFLNCHYTGPARHASDQQLEVLREVCPHLYNDGKVRKYFIIGVSKIFHISAPRSLLQSSSTQ